VVTWEEYKSRWKNLSELGERAVLLALEEARKEIEELKEWIVEIAENKDAFLDGKLNSEDTENFFDKIENLKEEIVLVEKRLGESK